MPEPPDPTREQVTEQMEGNQEAAEVALAAADELAAIQEENERLRTEVAGLQDQLLRRAADFQNYRRRTDQELGEARERGRGEVVTELLDVLDDLQRTLEAAREAAHPADPLLQGVELVVRKFEEALARFGVVPIEAVGQPFDPHLHDALMQQPSPGPEAPSGTVLAEVQRGYRLGERVLRHARVIVAQ
ncbi:MAG TPA: nucleotide exchange factor GrpE [Rubricoccaceae bacterium]|nr:nucleotide exchange factor GrpE [Rubricoccaceae bacterium]